MNISKESFIGIWKGAHENGLSAFTIDLKKENDEVIGIWSIDGLSGGEWKKASEIPITASRLHENRFLFKPNPNGAGLMALELTSENEATFAPFIDPEEIDRHFGQIAAVNRKMFGVETPREMFDANSPELKQSVQSHTVRMRRDASV
jgi:hypothetical protein